MRAFRRLQGAGGQEEGRHRRRRRGRRRRPGADGRGDLPPGAPAGHLRRPRRADGDGAPGLPRRRDAPGRRHGDGPVDAVCRAITRLVDIPNRLSEFSVQSVSAGIDAIGEVSVRVESDEGTFIGRGASTDIVVASARAYLNALNKVVAARRDREAGHSHRAAVRPPARSRAGRGLAAAQRSIGRAGTHSASRRLPREETLARRMTAAPKTLFEKIWDAHVVRAGAGRAGAALHRPAPGARGDLAAGLRGPAPGGAQGAPAGPDRGHHGPQRPHLGPQPADDRRDLPAADGDAGQQLRASSASPSTTCTATSRASSTSSARSWA